MSDQLDVLAERVAEDERHPLIVGIAGAVAVGKTTIATRLADRLAARGRGVQVISTDAFLLPNSELGARDILMRKGFPESYDAEELITAVETVRQGEGATIRVYSHAIYDIVAGEEEVVPPTDVLIVEGVLALQTPVREVLDVAIYVHAAEDIVRRWFVDRFLRFCADAKDDAASFYHGFAQLEPVQIRSIAEATWDGINAVNLHDHIAPSMAFADVVVEKGGDHGVLAVRSPA